MILLHPQLNTINFNNDKETGFLKLKNINQTSTALWKPDIVDATKETKPFRRVDTFLANSGLMASHQW